MLIKKILDDACLRADEDSSEFVEKAVVYMNDILVELLPYENNLLALENQEAIKAPRVQDIEQAFPYHAELISPCSLLLSSAIMEDDDLNKSALWRNRAGELLAQGRVYQVIDNYGWGSGDNDE